MKHILVDYENIQPNNFNAIKHPEKFHIWLFLGKEQQEQLPYPLVKSLFRFKSENIHFIEMQHPAKNALNQYLSFYLGKIAENDKQAHAYIFAKGLGCDALAQYINHTYDTLRVFRLKDMKGISDNTPTTNNHNTSSNRSDDSSNNNHITQGHVTQNNVTQNNVTQNNVTKDQVTQTHESHIYENHIHENPKQNVNPQLAQNNTDNVTNTLQVANLLPVQRTDEATSDTTVVNAHTSITTDTYANNQVSLLHTANNQSSKKQMTNSDRGDDTNINSGVGTVVKNTNNLGSSQITSASSISSISKNGNDNSNNHNEKMALKDIEYNQKELSFIKLQVIARNSIEKLAHENRPTNLSVLHSWLKNHLKIEDDEQVKQAINNLIDKKQLAVVNDNLEYYF